VWLAIASAAVPLAAQGLDTRSNQIGRVTCMGNARVRRCFEYDPLGRATRTLHSLEGQAFLYQTDYGYPQNPTTTTGPGTVPLSMSFPAAPGAASGEVVRYGYDAAGGQRTVTTQLPGLPAQDVVRDIRRNARGQTTRLAYGNGVERTYAYNEASDLRLRQVQTRTYTGAVIQENNYTFDRNGNVLELRQGAPGFEHLSASYTYDSLDQLVTMTGDGKLRQYRHDAVGNLIEGDLTGKEPPEVQVQEYGGPGRGPHALARVHKNGSVVEYSYDPNGNVVCIGPCATGTRLTWNAENMATEARQGGVVKNRKLFLGESVWKKEEGALTTLYLPDLMVETENGQTRLRKYFGAFAERSAEDAELRFYHPDHLGSSTVMTDQAQSVARWIAYMPYGADRREPGGSFTPRRQFNFKVKDATGFYDYGARLYDPTVGRWLSADAIAADGPNRYTYVRNNPLRFVDPNGRWSEDIHNRILAAALHHYHSDDTRFAQWAANTVDWAPPDGRHFLDYLPYFQTKGRPITILSANAHQHAMREVGEKVWQARRRTQRFIDDNLALARRAQDAASQHNRRIGGVNPEALFHFARAMHTVMDATSPAHRGFQVFKPWNLNSIGGTVMTVVGAVSHGSQEKGITEEQIAANVRLIRYLYLKTFGRSASVNAFGETAVRELEQSRLQPVLTDTGWAWRDPDVTWVTTRRRR
jgi:RHS repeat-associated protein